MDPHATWEQLLSALVEADWDRIEELAQALSEWLAKGGFPPTVLGVTLLGPAFDRALAVTACRFILAECRRRQTAAVGTGGDS